MDTKRIYHDIVKEISDLIDAGTFAVGSRLPSERELAVKFNVNRACIREAQIVLEAQGRLKVKAGSGAYVFDKDDTGISSVPSAGCFELIEAHALFEAEVAALAATLITSDDIIELEKLALIIGRGAKNEMAPHKAVAAFFALIARVTNNRAIMFTIKTIWMMKAEINPIHRIDLRVYSEGFSVFIDDYYAIIEALKKRDPEHARKATQDHFANMMKVLLEASEVDAYEDMKRKTSETRSRFLLSTKLI